MVKGEIKLDTAKWLCFSIPYSKGWQAYVDGEKTRLHRANIQYMALQLKAGRHTVELIYHTPLLREGICISAVSLIIFLAAVQGFRRKKKRITSVLSR